MPEFDLRGTRANARAGSARTGAQQIGAIWLAARREGYRAGREGDDVLGENGIRGESVVAAVRSNGLREGDSGRRFPGAAADRRQMVVLGQR